MGPEGVEKRGIRRRVFKKLRGSEALIPLPLNSSKNDRVSMPISQKYFFIEKNACVLVRIVL